MARKKTVKSETTDLAQPQNRTEEFLAKIAGLVDTLPQGEFSRLERYLKYIAENGGGGGGGGVTSFNTRTGAVTPESGDYSSFYAPAGYGFGGGVGEYLGNQCATEADIDAKLTTVFNQLSYRNMKVVEVYVYPAYDWTDELTFEVYKINDSAGWAFGRHYSTSTTVLKLFVNGAWQPTVYTNPPLIAGTEYRTSERFGGKPVYVKAVSVTSIPTPGGYATTPHGITNLGTVLSCTGTISGNVGNVPTTFSSPYITPTDFFSLSFYSASAQGIVFYSASTQSASVTLTGATAILKYTKTTD